MTCICAQRFFEVFCSVGRFRELLATKAHTKGQKVGALKSFAISGWLCRATFSHFHLLQFRDGIVTDLNCSRFQSERFYRFCQTAMVFICTGFLKESGKKLKETVEEIKESHR